MKREWNLSQYEYLTSCIQFYDYESEARLSASELTTARSKLVELLKRCENLYPYTYNRKADNDHAQKYLFRLYMSRCNMRAGRYDNACSYIEEMLHFEKLGRKERIPRVVIANLIATLKEEFHENHDATACTGA